MFLSEINESDKGCSSIVFLMASALLERFEMVGVGQKASDECLTEVTVTHKVL